MSVRQRGSSGQARPASGRLLTDRPTLALTRALAATARAYVIRKGSEMAKYRMVYGDDSQVVRETYDNVDDVQREDGWPVLFRGSEVIIRVQEAHVQSFDELPD